MQVLLPLTVSKRNIEIMSSHKFTATEITGMLSTRLCHDLAGPISAVHNGIELVTDPDGNMDKDMRGQVQELLKMSSHESLAKLQMFRMAYGKATDGITADVSELQEIIERYYSSSKLSLEWDIDSPSGKITLINRRFITLGCLVASSILIFGGTLHIALDKEHIYLKGEHTRIKQNPELANIYATPQGNDIQLTTDNILAHYLLLLASEQKSTISFNASETNINIYIENML
jgi:histidine phosphotransferase ChpT